MLTLPRLQPFLTSLVMIFFAASWLGYAAEAVAALQSPLLAEAAEKPAKGFQCDKGPQPVIDLDYSNFYKDGSQSSVIDPQKMKAYRADVQTVRDYENLISKLADTYQLRGKAPTVADCLLSTLERWAVADAFLGKASKQGGYVRKWALATTAAAYQKLPYLPSSTQHQRIQDWLRQWGNLVLLDYSTDTTRTDNHLYWAGWALAATAVALDEPKYLDWAVEVYKRGVDQITEDGFLPVELKRRSKALHYHVYALGPLVMIAETAAANGVDLYSYRNGRLHQAIQTTLVGWNDPNLFETRTGYSQTFVGAQNARKLTWLEPYLARFPNPDYDALIRQDRPLNIPRLGGKLTDIFQR